MEIKDLLEEFKLDMEINNYSKESLRSYSNCIKLFSTYLTDVLSITQIEKVKAVHIKAFVKFNKDRGIKQKTQNSYVSCIRAFYSFLIREDIVEKNLGYTVKLKKATDQKEIEIFTNEEMKKLSDYKRIGNIQHSPFLKARDELIINFLLETGCRNHEVHNLKDEDIKDGFIYFKVTKYSKARIVPYSKKLKKIMLRYERERLKRYPNGTEYYFVSRTGGKLYNPNISQVVKRACKECGIDDYKAYPHNFRHTFAVNTLKNTNDIYLVSKLLGHCNVSITEIYLQGLTNHDIVEMVKGNTILDNL